jgi:hypothetical protein
MKKQRLFLFLFFLFLVGKSSSQGFLLTKPRLVINGNQLLIFYDIITKNSADKFYIWVEMEKANGDKILAKAFSGDVGGSVKAGNSKKIIWASEQDSIYINEEVFVEVKAEKYIKSLSKGSMMFKSTVFPGWGQTNISKGKPWWLTGIVAYGTLAGGYLFHKSYLKSYDSYKIEKDLIKRADLLEQTQKQHNISTVMIYSAASAWVVNVLWVAFTPNRYQPLQHVEFSLNSSPGPYNGGLLLSLRLDF